jgi:hypothetical protein
VDVALPPTEDVEECADQTGARQNVSWVFQTANKIAQIASIAEAYPGALNETVGVYGQSPAIL